MDDDLVKRLRRRTLPTDMGGLTVYDEDPMCHEAADRIQALEAALAHIYAWYPISVTQPRQTIDDIREFAKAALGEKKDD